MSAVRPTALAVLPAGLRRRLDPGPRREASSIIPTTVTDVAGFFTFLGLARAFSALL